MGVPALTRTEVRSNDRFVLAKERLLAKVFVGTYHGVCLFRPDHSIEAPKARRLTAGTKIENLDPRILLSDSVNHSPYGISVPIRQIVFNAVMRD
ncbi:hypothetical protein [Allorhodopirellula heiligendammensis]|uniref:Uncharacterized protein n=1 Tax=Allorhodopirellula heiligendammensis TaxID=2714739 RepID=A0A5C6BY69_9BACT|nr:hypothetical protein [Allorhodopirellula heiligendammensis]TWU15784.1 hypothetical protein Poly21_29860 [Allorhodopirellula heiligendammensis]